MRDLAEAMAKEHAALGRELRKVLEALKAPVMYPSAIAPALVALRGHLMEHFRLEEENGYMEWVGQLHPEEHRAIRKLLAEHHELGEKLDALIVEVRTRPGLGKPFAARVHAWLEAMHRHEASENKLVESAVSEDVGTKD